MRPNNIVARYLDGRTVKGTSLNVDPNKPACHVRTSAGPVEVQLSDLKALFFVKDVVGDPTHDEGTAPTHGDPRLVGGKPIAVEFADGERIIGATNRYPPNRPFFFMVPVDPESNNIRILINRDAATAIYEAVDGPAAGR